MQVKSNEFSAAVSNILSDFSSGVSEEIEKAVEETAKRSLQVVWEKSPKRTGKYAKSWAATPKETGIQGKNTTVIIHNKKHYQLTHLLENGHRKRGGRGMTRAFPHIRDAEELAEELLPELIAKAVEEAANK